MKEFEMKNLLKFSLLFLIFPATRSVCFASEEADLLADPVAEEPLLEPVFYAQEMTPLCSYWGKKTPLFFVLQELRTEDDFSQWRAFCNNWIQGVNRKLAGTPYTRFYNWVRNAKKNGGTQKTHTF